MTTTQPLPSVTQESQNHLDSSIQRKQDEILQTKKRLVTLQIELSQMKKRKATMKSFSNFREELRSVMRPV